MATKYKTAIVEIESVVDLLFYPETWYSLGQIRGFCELLDVFYLDDVTRDRLNVLVDKGKLERRTFGGDYQWKLPLRQMSFLTD